MKRDIEIKLKEIVNVLLSQKQENNNYSLLSGKFGIALFLLSYSKYYNSNEIEQKGFDLIESVFDDIEASKYPIYTFCNGIAGIGCGLDYAIKNKLIDADINKILDSNIDDYLFEMLKLNLSINNWDYLHGALGVGAYFLMKSQYMDSALEKLDYLITYLENTAQEESNNLKWQCIIDRETKEIGYNISLSHGIASIAAFMTKLFEKGIFQKRTEKLARGSLNYILSQEIDVNKYGSYFPSFSKEQNNGIYKSRLGWCYGDLGIAAVLFNASKVFSEKSWKYKSIEVLSYIANNRKDMQSNSIFDSGLCHGASGVGNIFYSVWYNTKLQIFKDAADYWYNKTLEMATYTDGLAGFKTYNKNKEEILEYINDNCIITGISGIGLSLLYYINEDIPKWDEFFLLR